MDGVCAGTSRTIAYSVNEVEVPFPGGLKLLNPFLCTAFLMYWDAENAGPAAGASVNGVDWIELGVHGLCCILGYQ